MERTNQPALEQAERAFNRVGVDVGTRPHVFLARVVDGFVHRVLVHDAAFFVHTHVLRVLHIFQINIFIVEVEFRRIPISDQSLGN